MELNKMLEYLRKEWNEDNIHESKRRILMGIEYAIKRELLDSVRIRTLEAAIIENFIREHSEQKPLSY